MFSLIQWALTLLSSAILLAIYRHRRYLFVKPSLLLLAYTHIFFQWPATLQSAHFQASLPDAYVLILAVHGFAILGLLVASTTGHRPALATWRRLVASPDDSSGVRSAILLLGVFVIAIVSIYLATVPYTETGLYAILNNPVAAALARENSLKLLGNRWVAYLYVIMASAAAPLLTVVLATQAAYLWRRRAPLRALLCVAGIAMLIVVSSLSGARAYSVNLVFVIGLAIAFRHGLPFRPVRYGLALMVVLAPAVLLTLMREGRLDEIAVVGQLFVSAILERAFVGPLEVGTWYIRHMELHGPIGIGAVPRLASLVGVAPVDAPNMIGLLYAPYQTSIQSISAGASFVLTYIGYFGVAALIMNLALLWMLDIVLLAYDRLPDVLLLPCVAGVSLATLNFISADYTVGWISHGFGMIVVLALLVSRAIRLRRPNGHTIISRLSIPASVTSPKY